MSTIVFLHAHPDDEASGSGATMRLAADAGHRVVCVFATNGDHGSAPTDLAEGETVVGRRRREAEASAQVLGIARVAWLGYADSGMHGWEQNAHETSFHGADTEEAAARLAAVLDEEGAEVVVGYDWHGGYGHPDHVKVHHVVHRAATLAAARPRVLEGTMNRDALRRQFVAAREAGMAPEDSDWDPDLPADDGNPLGTPEAELHWHVDGRPVLGAKRAALACHASQEDVGWMLQLPEEQFASVFGDEWFSEPGRAPGITDGLPFD
ncbi:PIG-L deacetylase family protein [Ornithinimicrobium cerasi]|uniref:N-acetylglucosaminyl deacetylase, LmbE family n=1 Tax=Ornithinimicrobium cerasi TaxID=2248773 RepID=A0A285VWK2_9MICO|nr:PIG-L family deacetylase [Ornithinimicrobium cerasi]SOC57978.1 N-acetylglucosaminyl deacetylase, LmbE family [Ornithinimicrobium cerasi]